MYTELRKQIVEFVQHSPDTAIDQFLGLMCGRTGEQAANATANILGSGFEGKQWRLGKNPGAPTLTAVRSFAELCVVNSHVPLLRSVVEAGAPVALVHLGMDKPAWLDYLCRTRVPDSERLEDESEFVERSLFMIATDPTTNGGAEQTILSANMAASCLAALSLAFECHPAHPDIEEARSRSSASRALVMNAQMSFAVNEASVGVAPEVRRRARAL